MPKFTPKKGILSKGVNYEDTLFNFLKTAKCNPKEIKDESPKKKRVSSKAIDKKR